MGDDESGLRSKSLLTFSTMFPAAAARSILIILLPLAPAGCSNPAHDAVRGRALTQQYQCGTCHEIPGVNGAHATVAVTLKSFGLRSYIAGRVPNTDENLTLWIVNPAALVPGTLMPSLGVTPADARAIAAYLRQLD